VQVEQEQRYSVEKQLRETVRRMAGDLHSGLQSSEDRLKRLVRILHRLSDDLDDEEAMQRDIAGFLKQPDTAVLISDRPASASTPAGAGASVAMPAAPYMLSRYVSSATLGPLSERGRRVLKSVAQFLLQLSSIESGLGVFKEHLEAQAVDGMVDKWGLGRALKGLGVAYTAGVLESVYQACVATAGEGAQEGREGEGRAGTGEEEVKGEKREEEDEYSSVGLAMSSVRSAPSEAGVALRDVLLTMPVWDLIMVR
jgi:hypothetical protein